MMSLSIRRVPDGIVLSWGPNDGPGHFVLDGLRQDFMTVPVMALMPAQGSELYMHWTDARRYLGFRLRRILGDKDMGATAVVDNPIGTVKYDAIRMTACRSCPNRVTVAFQSPRAYSMIKLFDVSDGRRDFIAETRDCMLTSDKIEPGRVYAAEGYLIENGEPVLAGCSDCWPCSLRPEGSGIRVFDEPLFSIITPVYNNERLAHRGLDSILCQTCRDLEVICVDDCSGTGTADILGWYADAYPGLIKIIRHDRNLGPAAGRNTGLAAAKGRYVMFPDSDDFMTPDLLERAAAAIAGHGFDFINCPLRQVKWDHDFAGSFTQAPDGRPYHEMPYEDFKVFDQVSACRRIIKLSVARKVFFPDTAHGWPLDRVYEDAAYMQALVSHCDTFAGLDGCSYFWEHRQRESTATLSTTGRTGLSSSEIWRKYAESRLFPIAMGRPDRRGDIASAVLKRSMPQFEKLRGSSCWSGIAERLGRFFVEYDIAGLEEVKADPALLEWALSLAGAADAKRGDANA